MLSDETTRYFIVAEACVVVVTLLGGIFKYLLDQAAKDDSGSLCCQKTMMRHFVAKRPHPLRYIFGATTNIPEVPTVASLILAGDYLIYTSSLFDQIPAIPREVCWVNLYTQFFDEMAWLRKSWTDDTRNGNKFIKRYLAQADRQVPWLQRLQKLVKLANGFITAVYHTLLRTASLDLEKQAIELTSTQAIPRSHHSAVLHRHSMYQHDQRENANGPYLVSCVRPLAKDHRVSDKELNFLETRPLWILDAKPCIEISREELAGLALAMGIPLTKHEDGSISGAGPFGAFLFLSRHLNNWLLRLTHQNRQPTHDASKGSGYSTLFAKHMASASLPLNVSDGEIRSILVDGSVVAAVAKYDVHEFVLFQGTLSIPGVLTCMPTAYKHKVYTCDPWQVSQGNSSKKSLPSSSWFDAVAGIAFGGLVPQASKALVEAVLFTVTGEYRKEHRTNASYVYVTVELQNLVYALHLDCPKLELFGKYIAERARIGSRKPDSMEVFSGICTSRDAGALFSRYMTALERLAAMAVSTKTAAKTLEKGFSDIQVKETSPIPRSTETQLPGMQSGMYIEPQVEEIKPVTPAATCADMDQKLPVELIHEECRNLILESFVNQHRRDDPWSFRNRLKDVTDKIKEGKQVDIRDCAEVARCIIVVWANRVPYIELQWTANDEDLGSFVDASGSGLDNPKGSPDGSKGHPTVPLEELPAVCAFGI